MFWRSAIRSTLIASTSAIGIAVSRSLILPPIPIPIGALTFIDSTRRSVNTSAIGLSTLTSAFDAAPPERPTSLLPRSKPLTIILENPLA